MKLISLSIPVHLNSGSRSIHATILDGSTSLPVSIADDHPQWAKAFQLVTDLQNQKITSDDFADAFKEVVSIEKTLTEKFVRLGGILDGRMTISSSGVTVDYEPIDPVLESHILRMLEDDGTPRDARNWSAFSKFIENLYANQDDFVRKQLFGWMSFEDLYGTGLTLTEDGCFIGYKGCTGTPDAPLSIRSGHAIADGVHYNGQIPNKLGSTVEMPRREVTADPAIACGPGLHIGTLKYAKSWAQGVLLTVKVNPRDVVSVPVDCNAQKIRACRYEVLEVVENAYTVMTYSASTPKPSRSVDSKIVSIIEEAIESGARLKISYVDSKGQASIRVLSAAELEDDVLKAWCENANAPRSFSLSGIRSAEILEEDESDDEDATEVLDVLSDVPLGTELSVAYINKKGKHTERVVSLLRVDNTYFVGQDVDSGKIRSFSFENVQSLDIAGDITEDEDEDACECPEGVCVASVTIEDVIATGLDLEITYTNSKGEDTVRVITPDRIVEVDSGKRLLAYCHAADDFRTFLVSSITAITILPETEDLDEEIAEEVARNGFTDSPPAW